MAPFNNQSPNLAIGQAIKHARLRKSLTQPQFADLLSDATGDSFQAPTISKIEKGSRPLSLEEGAAISRILEISPTVMFEHYGELLSGESRLDQLSVHAKELAEQIKYGLLAEVKQIAQEFSELKEMFEEGAMNDIDNVALVFKDYAAIDERLNFITKLLSLSGNELDYLGSDLNLDMASQLELDRQNGK